MASTCISSCTSRDTILDNQIPSFPRANYNNLYKRPESDAEFMLRSISFTKDGGGGDCRCSEKHDSSTGGRRFCSSGGVKVVDSLSCRQMYLRSYTFSKKESLPEKTKKYCVEKVKFLAHMRRRGQSRSSNDGGFSCCRLVKYRIGHGRMWLERARRQRRILALLSMGCSGVCWLAQLRLTDVAADCCI